MTYGARESQAYPGAYGCSPTPLSTPSSLAEDRTPWLSSRAHVFVPVKALPPSSRALFKANRGQARLLEPSAPQAWHIPWHVHRQTHPQSHTACTSLAPSLFS